MPQTVWREVPRAQTKNAQDCSQSSFQDQETKGRPDVLNATRHMVLLGVLQPMDCSLPGSSVHGVFQARIILEPVATSYSKGSSGSRDRIHVS